MKTINVPSESRQPVPLEGEAVNENAITESMGLSGYLVVVPARRDTAPAEKSEQKNPVTPAKTKTANASGA